MYKVGPQDFQVFDETKEQKNETRRTNSGLWGFEGIIDFLNASLIRYALTVNPTIYTSCIKQFWATAKAKTVNGEVQIQALVDRKKVIVTETSVRKALQLKDAEEPFTNKAANEEHVPIHSNDPLLSGEDILKLIELMELCTNLPQRVLDLENIKTSQASEITKLKERVKKLERRNKSRTPGLKRLRKVGRTARIKSSEDEGLGAQEDASKQGRKIVDLDVNAEVTLVDEAQGRIDDNLMFDTGVFDEQEVKVEKAVSTAEVTIVSATTTTIDKLTLAQTLIEIKAAKPKAFTTAATTTTTVVISPKARGVVVQDPKIAQRLQEELQAKLEEEERLARQKEEEDNLISFWRIKLCYDGGQIDYVLAQRLQAEEQGELTIEERSKLFVELMDKRKKHFAKLRAEEIRRKPPTKAQKRNQMCTYLKNVANYKHKVMEGSKSKVEGNENVQAEVDDEVEMKKHMEIVSDDEVAIDAIPLATKSLIIVDWRIIKEGKMGYIQIINADRSSRSSVAGIIVNVAALQTLKDSNARKRFLYHLGKFDGKADKGFFVGYSINNKAFREFNSRTRIVEENLHVQFSENTPNIAGSTKACDDAGKARMETSSPDAGFKPSGDDEKKVTKEPRKVGGDSRKDSEGNDQEKEDNFNNTNTVNVASTNEVNVVGAKTSIELPDDSNTPELEDIIYSDDDEDFGVEADMNSLDAFMPINPIPTTRIHKDHPVEQIIRDLNSAPQTRRMNRNLQNKVLFSSV
ncbi:hypothetical protein Tco_0909737 [Tanacetum coccineum]|uniref:Retroviral polymerase SH3-like domain-containing protein n=1 Tax=Tanacetum coccineum TaxID=301880 RepID=A0ABQ5CTM4_9ASTR